MAIVLRRLRPRRGRTANPSTGRGYRSHRRYHRRNPDLAGTPLGNIVAVGGGAYLTRQVASAVSGVAAPLTNAIDKLKSGLGAAVLSGLSAIGVGWGVGKWRRSYGTYAQLGGLAIAANQAVGAVIPGFDALAGLPSVVQNRGALNSGSGQANGQGKGQAQQQLPAGSVQAQL